MRVFDGFGDDTELSEDDFLADCDNWLSGTARLLCISRPWTFDDARAEGQIMLWSTYRKHADKPFNERVSYAFAAAKMRMRNVAWKDEALTGTTRLPGQNGSVKETFSMDMMWEEGLQNIWAAVDLPDGIELAYHQGEILEALNSLTEKQRKYVYARFWCGMDPAGMHSNAGLKEARDNNPYLRRDILWTGSKTSKGAKRALQEALSHLASV